MANCSPSELVAAGKCFAALPPKLQPPIIAVLLCRLLKAVSPMASCDPTTLMKDAECFACLPPNQVWAIIAQLLCEILHSGGTGETCIVCLEADGTPTDPAPCACSIAYNLIGQFWFWDSINSAWFPISM